MCTAARRNGGYTGRKTQHRAERPSRCMKSLVLESMCLCAGCTQVVLRRKVVEVQDRASVNESRPIERRMVARSTRTRASNARR